MALNIPAPILETLLKQDGILLPASNSPEVQISCFNPHHKDSKPSMCVNTVKGLYNCQACGMKGNAFMYLTNCRGLDSRQAAEILLSMGASSDYIRTQEDFKNKTATTTKGSKPFKTPKIPDYINVKQDKYDLTDTYDYLDKDGKVLVKIAFFYMKTSDPAMKPKKVTRPFVTCSEDGHWWWAGPLNDMLPPEDKSKLYPLYNIPELAAIQERASRMPDMAKRQIWIVEGEKCAKWAQSIAPPNGPPPIVTTMMGGAGASRQGNITRHDLTYLYNSKVLLIADADRHSRDHMKRLGRFLKEYKCNVRYLLPPGNDGFDIADAIAQGGTWQALLKWIENCGGVKPYDEIHPPKEEPPIIPASFLANTKYFKVMGQEGDSIVIQSKKTSKIHRFASSRMNAEGTLISIAPLEFWRQLGEIDSKSRLLWADAMIRASEEAGEINSLDRSMWRRGAIITKDRDIAYNIGNSVLYQDDKGLMTRRVDLADANSTEDGQIFLPGQPIKLVDDDNAAEYCSDLYHSIMGYRWEKPEYGQAFAGWLVTSLVGGALPFRPMMWITAKAETGKTFLFEHILRPLFGSLVTDLADATEAGIAGIAQDAALPCYLDEFEPKEHNANRMQDILSLMRVATSGSGGRVRGNPGGGYIMTRPRFSVIFGSIDMPKLNEANDSRLVAIRLAQKGVENWPKVRDSIIDAVMPEKSTAICTHIIRHTSKIVELETKIENELLEFNVSTREAQIRAALSAGVRFLSGDETFVLPGRDRKIVDQFRPMSILFSAMIQERSGRYTTIAEALYRGYFGNNGNWQGPDREDDIADMVRRYGFTFHDRETLAVAVNWHPMEKLLKGTEFENFNLTEYFKRLPGVVKTNKRPRKMFANQQRSVILLPKETLDQIGFFTNSGKVVSNPSEIPDNFII